jgi:hypothetical protein
VRTLEKAEILIDIAEEKDLLVRTLKRAITRASIGRQTDRTSTIHLFLASSQLVTCYSSEGTRDKSDYYL